MTAQVGHQTARRAAAIYLSQAGGERLRAGADVVGVNVRVTRKN